VFRESGQRHRHVHDRHEVIEVTVGVQDDDVAVKDRDGAPAQVEGLPQGR